MDRIDELNSIAYFAYVKDGDTIWLSNKRYNGLYSINTITGATNFLGRVEQYSYDKVIIHAYAIKYKNYICYLPQAGASIDLFDINTRMVQSFVIEQWSGIDKKIVAGYVQKESDIYIIPRMIGEPILIFSITDKTITKFMDMDIPELNFIKCSKYKTLANNIAFAKNKIWWAVFDSNLIMEVDILTADYKVYTLPENYKLHSISFNEEEFWISSGLSVIRWSPKYGILEEYDEILTHSKYELNIYSEFVFNKEYVYAIPQWNENIVWINRNTKETGVYDVRIDGCRLVNDSTQNWRHFRNAYMSDDELVINPIAYNMEIHINVITGKVYGREYLADKRSVYIRQHFFNEEEYDLNEYISAHVMVCGDKKEVEYENMGKKIYKVTSG